MGLPSSPWFSNFLFYIILRISAFKTPGCRHTAKRGKKCQRSSYASTFDGLLQIRSMIVIKQTKRTHKHLFDFYIFYTKATNLARQGITRIFLRLSFITVETAVLSLCFLRLTLHFYISTQNIHLCIKLHQVSSGKWKYCRQNEPS